MQNLINFFKDIKLSHSIFALPFALSILAIDQWQQVSLVDVCLVVLAIVCARSFAMGFNRFVDAKIDLKNERTKNRWFASGQISKFSMVLFIVLFGLGFIFVSFALNETAGTLSPIVLTILALYSYFKRFSSFSHFFLGMCLGLSPLGVSVATFGTISLNSILVGLTILFWVAGFDLIYALQDRQYDQKAGLFSFPSQFGVDKTVFLSRICFGVVIFLFSTIGIVNNLNIWFWICTLLCSAILIFEHFSIRKFQSLTPEDINRVFYTYNAWVSIIFFIGCLAGVSIA